MRLSDFEFYGTPNGSVMISGQGKTLKVYEVSDRDFTIAMIEKIGQDYPVALKALCEYYQKSSANKAYFEYLIVHRFIRCNFKEYDSHADIDTQGSFRFEFVSCPLRGECKYCDVICNPKFNSKLSDAELKVMKLFCQSHTAEEISDTLFISINTVKKHKHNALSKMGMHNLHEFIAYAAKNKMFDNE